MPGFLAGREAARLMLPRDGGAIFFTGATASLRGGAGYARLPPPRPGCARWHRVRHANLAPATSTSRISSSTPAWTPHGCANGSGRARATKGCAISIPGG